MSKRKNAAILWPNLFHYVSYNLKIPHTLAGCSSLVYYGPLSNLILKACWFSLLMGRVFHASAAWHFYFTQFLKT